MMNKKLTTLVFSFFFSLCTVFAEPLTDSIATPASTLPIEPIQTNDLLTLSAPPVNDNCSGAIAFPTLSAPYVCSSVNGTTVDATGTGLRTCAGTADDDVWFSFTIPTGYNAVHYKFTEISGSDNRRMELYSGSCSSLTSRQCVENGLLGNLQGLIPGTTYFLRVYTTYANASSTFSLCLELISPNDDCAKALAFPTIPTNGDCATVEANSKYMTQGGPGDCYGSIIDDDLWFTFVMPVISSPSGSVTGLQVVQTNIVASSTVYGGLRYQVFSGTCSGLTRVYGCYTTSTPLITGLVGGQTYYIRFYTSDYGEVAKSTVCLKVVRVLNNECISATPLTPNPNETCTYSATNQTTRYSTESLPVGKCGVVTNGAYDVWYSFVATSSYHSILLGIGPLSDGRLVCDVFKGTCGNLTSFYCNITIGTPYAISELVVGNTYYIRIYSLLGGASPIDNFSICILTPPPPPANDNFSGALALTVAQNCSGSYSSSTQYATFSSNPPPNNGCASEADFRMDVWFSFVATHTAHRIDIRNIARPGGFLAVFDLYTGNNYPNLTIVKDTCAYNFFIESNYYTHGSYKNLTIGTTYYIRMYSQVPGYYHLYDVCVSAIVPPVNDDIENALTLNGGGVAGKATTTPIVGSTQGATFKKWVSFPLSNNDSNDDDVWYKFTTDGDGGNAEIKLALTTNTFGSLNIRCDGCHFETAPGTYVDNAYITTLRYAPPRTEFYISVHSRSFGVQNVANFTLAVSGTALQEDPSVEYVFTGNRHDLWNDPFNWTPYGVPSRLNDTAVISGNKTVRVHGDYIIGKLKWDGGEMASGSINANVEMNLSGNPAMLYTPLTLRAGSIVKISNPNATPYSLVLSSLTNYGTIEFSGLNSIEIQGVVFNHGTMRLSGSSNFMTSMFCVNQETGVIELNNGNTIHFTRYLDNYGKIKGSCNSGIIAEDGIRMYNTAQLELPSCSSNIYGLNILCKGRFVYNTTQATTLPLGILLRMQNSPYGSAPDLTFTNPFLNNGHIVFNNSGRLAAFGITLTNGLTGKIEVNDDDVTESVLTTNSVPVTNNGTIKTGLNDKIVFNNGFTTGTTGMIGGLGTLEAAGSTFVLRGTVAPGASPGIMTINGSVTNASNTNYQMELEQSGATTLHDKLIVTGTFDGANAIMNVVEIGAGTVANGTYDLVECQGGANCILNGFNTVTKPANYSVVVTGTKISVVKNVALPIELINFTAKINNKKAELNWQTATEINVKNFEIEKSFDSKLFEKIAEIKANNTPSVYQAFDDTPLGAGGYYRLKINDLDGTSDYSKIIFLEKDSDKSIKITRNTEGSILIETNDKIELITITNPIGQVIKSTKEKQFFINEFNSGIYIISVKTDKGFLSQKIFKD